MAAGYATTLRAAQLNQIITAIDAGGAAATLTIYSGTRPATGGALSGNTVLISFPLAYPVAATTSTGTLTFSAVASAVAAATGTASWGRITTSAGVFVIDGGCASPSGAEFNLNTLSIVSGESCTVNSITFTNGNP
jgi:hypothetical protein